jgi:hypothetical protein
MVNFRRWPDFSMRGEEALAFPLGKTEEITRIHK